MPNASSKGICLTLGAWHVRTCTGPRNIVTRRLYLQSREGTECYLQVVAGLKQHVEREALQGSLAVAILNLKPAKLAGEASEAMLLAADAPLEGGGELVKVLIPPGECHAMGSHSGLCTWTRV